MSFYGIFLQIRKYVEIYTAIKVEFLSVEKECIAFEIDFLLLPKSTDIGYQFTQLLKGASCN